MCKPVHTCLCLYIWGRSTCMLESEGPVIIILHTPFNAVGKYSEYVPYRWSVKELVSIFM